MRKSWFLFVPSGGQPPGLFRDTVTSLRNIPEVKKAAGCQLLTMLLVPACKRACREIHLRPVPQASLLTEGATSWEFDLLSVYFERQRRRRDA